MGEHASRRALLTAPVEQGEGHATQATPASPVTSAPPVDVPSSAVTVCTSWDPHRSYTGAMSYTQEKTPLALTHLGVKSRIKARERVSRWASLHLCQRRLGLWEPEGHVHTPIPRHRQRQRGTGLLLLTRRGLQQAQAAVAVRLERTHAHRGQWRALCYSTSVTGSPT